MAGGHAKWPQLGREGVRKKKRGGEGGCGTETASLNQQHFLNIFNVKTNAKKKERQIEATKVAPKFGTTSGSAIFYCSGAL